LAFHHSENRRRWAVRFGTPELYQESVKGYYRLITSIDDVIGSLRATLARLDLADNTIIVYSADHGIFNGEHGFAGKWFGHEESVRIPLIVFDPRTPASDRGKRSDAMTLNIDLHPTLLDWAGLPPNAATHGKSVLRSQSEARSVWYLEHRFPNHGWIPSSEGIRTKRWKYIRYTDVAAPFEELYDLTSNPTETANLIGNPDYRPQQQALTRYCEKWNKALAPWKPEMPWRDPVSEADLRRDGLE
jgi:arylsulfatase A-like enzyme